MNTAVIVVEPGREVYQDVFFNGDFTSRTLQIPVLRSGVDSVATVRIALKRSESWFLLVLSLVPQEDPTWTGLRNGAALPLLGKTVALTVSQTEGFEEAFEDANPLVAAIHWRLVATGVFQELWDGLFMDQPSDGQRLVKVGYSATSGSPRSRHFFELLEKAAHGISLDESLDEVLRAATEPEALRAQEASQLYYQMGRWHH